MRRTTIILYGILGGAGMVVAVVALNHLARRRRRGRACVCVVGGALGLFVLAGATPAALGLLADISEAFPAIAARSWASIASSWPSARSPAR